MISVDYRSIETVAIIIVVCTINCLRVVAFLRMRKTGPLAESHANGDFFVQSCYTLSAAVGIPLLNTDTQGIHLLNTDTQGYPY